MERNIKRLGSLSSSIHIAIICCLFFHIGDPELLRSAQLAVQVAQQVLTQMEKRVEKAKQKLPQAERLL